jgi:opacity protein-like surface antigen
MKLGKIVLSMMLLLSSSVMSAEQENESVDASRAHIEAKHHEEGDFYMVPKLLLTLGDTYTEEAKEGEAEAKLEGDVGGGVGLDLGYRVGYGFAVEFDFAYAHTNVTKHVESEEAISAGADYYSYGLDLIYGYHVNETFVTFAKVGWEIEQERISDFDISGTNNGFAYAVGLEYGLNEHWAVLGEYEGSLIDGPRGNSVFVGTSYTF